MAVGANEIQLTITNKVPLEGGRAMYFGTAQGGTAYATGGAELGEEGTNSRYKLPARLDWFALGAGLPAYLVALTQKIKLLAVTATEAGESELANGKTMATAVPAGTPFWAVGLG